MYTDLYTEGGHDAQTIDGTSNDDGTGDLSDLSSQLMAQQLKLSVTTEPEIGKDFMTSTKCACTWSYALLIFLKLSITSLIIKRRLQQES